MKGQKTAAVLLDLSKAFDFVNHDILISIITSVGISGHCGELIKSFLYKRSFRIKYSDEITPYEVISNGVPQGSILSPFLYNLYVSKINQHIPYDVIQYADDTTILVPFMNSFDLEQHLNILSSSVNEYFNGLGLRINEDKTQIIIFKNKSIHQTSYNYKTTSISTSVKFLGINISSSLNFDHHIEQICNKIRSFYRILYKIRDFLDDNNKILFFKSSIWPHIIYAIPFILNSNNASLKQLSRIYNRAIKILFKQPYLAPSKNLPKLTKILPLDQLLIFHCCLYLHKIFYSHAPSIIQSTYETSTNNFILKPFNVSSFYNTITQHWNSLPRHLKSIKHFPLFKKTLLNPFHTVC